MSAMVAIDLFRRHLAPLQARLYPTWFYSSDNDNTHLARCGIQLRQALLAHLLRQVTDEGDIAAGLLPEGITPLCEDEACQAVLESLPRTDARGLAPFAAHPAEAGALGIGSTRQYALVGDIV